MVLMRATAVQAELIRRELEHIPREGVEFLLLSVPNSKLGDVLSRQGPRVRAAADVATSGPAGESARTSHKGELFIGMGP